MNMLALAYTSGDEMTPTEHRRIQDERAARVERYAIRRDHLRRLTLLPWWWCSEASDREPNQVRARQRVTEAERRAARHALFRRHGGPWIPTAAEAAELRRSSR